MKKQLNKQNTPPKLEAMSTGQMLLAFLSAIPDEKIPKAPSSQSSWDSNPKKHQYTEK